MPPERDLMDALADDFADVARRDSDWVRDRDLTEVAAVARVARGAGGSFGRHLLGLEQATNVPTAPNRHVAGAGAGRGAHLNSETDHPLLRVVAHAVLIHLERLHGEGLHSSAVEALTSHAMALTAEPSAIADDHDRCRTHGLGLWESLSALTGPTSSTLLVWLDDALGPTP